MRIPADSSLFNPHLGSRGRSKYRNRVMESIYHQRGIQEECARCVKACKVLSGSKSKFVCMDAETRERNESERR